MEGAVRNKWLDPADFKTLEEFHKAYAEAYGRARAYQEIMMILDNAGVLARNIAKEMAKPKKDYASI